MTCDIHQGDQDPNFISPAHADWARYLDFDTHLGVMSARANAPSSFIQAMATPGHWNLNEQALQRARAEVMRTEREIVVRERATQRRPTAEVLRERIAVHQSDPQPFQTAVLSFLRGWLTRQP
ncbi:MAG: hypothetical protein DI536_05740 [Archangium gephyra]|uniref:Uncharacterized protein n=1 Tax=Archangium gephyra TaxID=48 RepID=A0A2W5V5N1_9BACT|nr:MAG: hypothetical protein DI536_05740 [Archangium gephyra]